MHDPQLTKIIAKYIETQWTTSSHQVNTKYFQEHSEQSQVTNLQQSTFKNTMKNLNSPSYYKLQQATQWTISSHQITAKYTKEHNEQLLSLIATA